VRWAGWSAAKVTGCVSCLFPLGAAAGQGGYGVQVWPEARSNGVDPQESNKRSMEGCPHCLGCRFFLAKNVFVAVNGSMKLLNITAIGKMKSPIRMSSLPSREAKIAFTSSGLPGAHRARLHLRRLPDAGLQIIISRLPSRVPEISFGDPF
jgi:hypothetical protein